MSRITEIFGLYAKNKNNNFTKAINDQECPYTNRKCIKTRKSNPDIAIGTCSLRYGKDEKDIIICPFRLIENNQIFVDCLHLLTLHEPGNELYVIPEVSIPGGNVDYFLVSAKDNKVLDFVGIELQTMDTTGTVWPERQRFLQEKGMDVSTSDIESLKNFGMNWKMTAKTILIQMHHKSETFEHINKHLVLIIQKPFYEYMQSEFSFGHISNARLGDPVHFHIYDFIEKTNKMALSLNTRVSTDSAGIATCLGLQAQSKIEIQEIIAILEAKLNERYRLAIVK